MSFNLFGIKVFVSVPFTALLAFLLIIDKTGMMTATLAAIIIHECGHIIAMRLFDCPIKSAKFCVGAVLIVKSLRPLKPIREIIIALSGSLVNIICGGLFWVCFLVWHSIPMAAFCFLQIIMAGFNLLPVQGLDGGTAIKSLLEYNLSEQTARLVANIISVVFTAALIILGGWLFIMYNRNSTLILSGVYLAVIQVISRRE